MIVRPWHIQLVFTPKDIWYWSYIPETGSPPLGLLAYAVIQPSQRDPMKILWLLTTINQSTEVCGELHFLEKKKEEWLLVSFQSVCKKHRGGRALLSGWTGLKERQKWQEQSRKWKLITKYVKDGLITSPGRFLVIKMTIHILIGLLSLDACCTSALTNIFFFSNVILFRILL